MTGALGRTHDAQIALGQWRGTETAVVEVANTCGLALLDEPDVWRASSRGVGEAICAALDAQLQRIVVAFGGSASTDGGLGLLMALGARAMSEDGKPVSGDARGMLSVTQVDPSPVRERLAGVDLVIATDVDAPLYGSVGATVVFAPQKSATSSDAPVLDAGLRRYASTLHADDAASCPGAGAAGGMGSALNCLGGQHVLGRKLP